MTYPHRDTVIDALTKSMNEAITMLPNVDAYSQKQLERHIEGMRIQLAEMERLGDAEDPIYEDARKKKIQSKETKCMFRTIKGTLETERLLHEYFEACDQKPDWKP